MEKGYEMNLLYIKSQKLIVNLDQVVSVENHGDWLALNMVAGKPVIVSYSQISADLFEKLVNLSEIKV